MPFRSAPATLLAAATAVVLLLSACSAETATPRSTSIDDVTVSTTETSASASPSAASSSPAPPPTIAVPENFSVAENAVRVVRASQGEVVDDGDVIGMQYVMINGRTAEQVAASDWEAEPTSLVVDGSVLPGLRSGLVGQRVGSEVLIAIAPRDDEAATGSLVGDAVEPGDSLLFLVSIVSAVPPRAEGTPLRPRPGLPTVTLDRETGEPDIDPTEGLERPVELVFEPLIRGNGPLVERGDTIWVHYTGVTWAGDEFDTSWRVSPGSEEPGAPVPFVIGEGQVIEAWDAALVDQPVGSQVLIIAPPEDGYGEDGNPEAGISGDDTLIFVVDILAAT